MKAERRSKSAIEEAGRERFVPSLLVVFQNFSLQPLAFSISLAAHLSTE